MNGRLRIVPLSLFVRMTPPTSCSGNQKERGERFGVGGDDEEGVLVDFGGLARFFDAEPALEDDFAALHEAQRDAGEVGYFAGVIHGLRDLLDAIGIEFVRLLSRECLFRISLGVQL